MAIYIRRDMDKTKSSSRHKEYKARSTSYYSESGCIEPHTAPSIADIAYPYSIPLNKYSYRWCTIYYIESCRSRD